MEADGAGHNAVLLGPGQHYDAGEDEVNGIMS